MIKELQLESNNHTLYGRLHLPEGDGPFPLVILCHGFNANMADTESYAPKLAAHGIAAFAFDFYGGGEENRSGGKLTDMTVLTERVDLLAVYSHLKMQPFTDPSCIFFMGQSQGGLVSLLTASGIPDEVRGLILCYPAFNLIDYVRMAQGRKKRIRETYPFIGGRVSHAFLEDALTVDILKCAEEYPGPVLILHGTADPVVPVSLSEEGITHFPGARLIEIEGAGHGFFDADESFAAEEMIRFVSQLCCSSHSRRLPRKPASGGHAPDGARSVRN